MKVIGTVVSIDTYHKAGVVVDTRGHWYVFSQLDCESNSLPSIQQKVFFEREETDWVNRAHKIELKVKAA